jgi:hypothetical protein
VSTRPTIEHCPAPAESNLHPDTVLLQNGLLSSLPYLGKYVFAVLTSALADHLLRTNRFSRTATRKLFTAIGKDWINARKQ